MKQDVGGDSMKKARIRVSKQIKYSILWWLLTVIIIVFVRSGSENSRMFLKWTQAANAVISRCFSYTGFSVAECLAILLPVLLFIYAARKVIMAIVFKSLKPLERCVLNLIHIFSAAACVFVLLWGGNYASVLPIEERLNVKLSATGYTYDDLLAAAELIGDKADGYAALIKRDAAGLPAGLDFESVKGNVQDVFSKLGDKYSLFKQTYYAQPKKIFNTELLSHLGIRGVYSPFTAEANINTNIPPISVPFVVCHETAHRLGIVREDEANFAAFLAGINSENAEYAYSAYITALIAIAERMYSEEPEKTQAWLSGRSEFVKADLYRYFRSGQRYNTKLKEIGTLANSAYIQAMGDGRGAESYNGITDLICAYYIGML